jgi:hypothetical protein
MKTISASLFLGLLFFAGLAPAWAQSTPATDEQKKEITQEIDDIEDAMFHPHWTAQLGLTSAGQPSQTGQGQITNELDFTGTDHLTEGGHYWAVGAGLGSQKVEGSQTGYTKATLEGGLGLGFFLPSLEFMYQKGQTALSSPALTATLNFQVFDPLTLGMSFNGALENHNGPESIVGGSSGVTIQIDDANWSSSLVGTFQAWDFLSFTLTGTQEYSVTYQVEGLKSKVTVPVDEAEQINSISLMADWTFLKNFELQVTAQTGVENLPAGTVYSVIQAKTVTATQASTENFNGYTLALLYNFD